MTTAPERVRRFGSAEAAAQREGRELIEPDGDVRGLGTPCQELHRHLVVLRGRGKTQLERARISMSRGCCRWYDFVSNGHLLASSGGLSVCGSRCGRLLSLWHAQAAVAFVGRRSLCASRWSGSRLHPTSVIDPSLNEVGDVEWANQHSVSNANADQLPIRDQLPDEPL
jgi:hypothetical protein